MKTAADSPYPVASGADDFRWISRPARKTWPGHTLLLGDSFTMVGLDSLAPLFRHGRFLWNKNNNEEVIAAAVAASDTVVIEVYQTFLGGSPLGSISVAQGAQEGAAPARAGRVPPRSPPRLRNAKTARQPR